MTRYCLTLTCQFNLLQNTPCFKKYLILFQNVSQFLSDKKIKFINSIKNSCWSKGMVDELGFVSMLNTTCNVHRKVKALMILLQWCFHYFITAIVLETIPRAKLSLIFTSVWTLSYVLGMKMFNILFICSFFLGCAQKFSNFPIKGFSNSG